MQRVKRALKRHKRQLMNFDNVVGIGTGYKIVDDKMSKMPSVMVLVEKKLPEKKLTRSQIIPRALEDVATDVLEVGQIQLLSSRTMKKRPAQPGMSIGHYKVTAGTLGALVRDTKTGEILILSNNHVLANATDGHDGKSKIGDAIYQPGAHDGGSSKDIIAYLERFVPLNKNYSKSQCPIAKRIERLVNFGLKIVKPDYEMNFIKKNPTPNLIDAAVARPVKPDLVDDNILGLGKIKGVAKTKLGSHVTKSGRTSGLTSNQIKAVDVFLKVVLGPGEEGNFYDQILAGPMAQPGDSGSIVVDENMNAIGLLFAGSDEATIINPIVNVMRLLNITF